MIRAINRHLSLLSINNRFQQKLESLTLLDTIVTLFIFKSIKDQNKYGLRV